LLVKASGVHYKNPVSNAEHYPLARDNPFHEKRVKSATHTHTHTQAYCTYSSLSVVYKASLPCYCPKCHLVRVGGCERCVGTTRYRSLTTKKATGVALLTVTLRRSFVSGCTPDTYQKKHVTLRFSGTKATKHKSATEGSRSCCSYWCCTCSRCCRWCCCCCPCCSCCYCFLLLRRVCSSVFRTKQLLCYCTSKRKVVLLPH